jgi:hypothetical protein
MTRIACVFVAALLCAHEAWATHPDHEGERGLEVQLSPGFAGYTANTERVFYEAADLPRDGSAPVAFGGGFALRGAVGWRFTPWLSAGVAGGVVLTTATTEYSPAEQMYSPSDSGLAWHVGAYARVYPLAFINGSRENRRVFFRSWSDLRRFDVWASLGVEYGAINRHRAYAGRMDYRDFTTSYVGVPVAIGGEYRLFTQLAVGLQASVTPMVGAHTSHYWLEHELRPGVDQMIPHAMEYTPADAANVQLYLGLSARYTFTW